MRLRHLLSSLAVASLFVLPLSAQSAFGPGTRINGVPPSVTSFGFGGHPGFHGVPPSVTSINFGRVPHPGNHGFGFPVNHFPGNHFGVNRHHGHGFVSPFYGSAYYVPYAYPMYVMDPGSYDSGQDYIPPSDSDRTGPDAQDQVRQELESLRSSVDDVRSQLEENTQKQQALAAPEPPEPPVNQPKTVLVFKDGHELEVANYAIVGTTLYDLSQGLTKKVSLAELDLAATMKQNDNRGVNFQLPAGVKLN
jgi:hypothetical protein